MYTYLLNSAVYCTSFSLPHDYHRLNIRACNDLLNSINRFTYKKLLSPYNISAHRFIELDQNYLIFDRQIRNFENFLALDFCYCGKISSSKWCTIPRIHLEFCHYNQTTLISTQFFHNLPRISKVSCIDLLYYSIY